MTPRWLILISEHRNVKHFFEATNSPEKYLTILSRLIIQHDASKHHLFNSHQNTEVDVTFKTNTFSSYQATKTAQRKNEQKLSTVVRWAILYGSCCLLKSLGGTGTWREQHSSALMSLAWIIRKYHSIARQVFAVSPNSIPLRTARPCVSMPVPVTINPGRTFTKTSSSHGQDTICRY